MLNKLKPYIFILPGAAFILAFVLYPVVGTVVTSFFRDVSFLSKKFIALENYQALFSDSSFRGAVLFTLLFTAVTVPSEVIIGLVFAGILNRKSRLRPLLRGCVLIPWAIPAAVSARSWQLIYNYSYGPLNYLLLKFGITDEPVNFLGTSAEAFFAVALADIWKTTPFAAIIILAGLQGLDEQLTEQAKIDGAGFFRRLFSIVLPILKPVLIVTVLFRTIDGLRVFDMIYVITGGGPAGATTSVSQYAYEYFLSGDFGFAAAGSVVLFAVSFALSLFYIKAASLTGDDR